MDVEMSLDDFCLDISNWCEQFFDSELFGSSYRALPTYELLIWVVGILGNFVNVVVFRHKNMAHQPINLIFWWLSISDLLELTIIALYQWEKDWNGWLTLIDSGSITWSRHIDDYVRYLIYIYLLQVVHTSTIVLNIALVFCQYMVVAYPLVNQNNLFNNQSIKLTVICIYILSFVLYLPFWYIYEIRHVGKDRWMHRVRSREDPLVRICIVMCGIVLRVGPLIILFIMCILLIVAIRNTLRNRESLGMEARHQTKAQKMANRMNVTIILIMLMFFITEIPLGMESFLAVSDDLNCKFLMNFYFLLPFILLNCSYSIFCYLLRIEKYRETLKLLVSKVKPVSSSSSVPVTEQTDLELHPL